MNEDESVPLPGDVMVAATAMKKGNNTSQKYDGGDPLGGIAAMVVAMVIE